MESESLTALTAAIAAGAAASMKDTASAAVKDAYAALKALIQKKYATVDLTAVERKPDSETKRASLQEDLADTGAAADAEILQLARAVTDAVVNHAPETGRRVGVDLLAVKAAFLHIGAVDSADAGVIIRDAEISGGIEIGSVRAGYGERRVQEEAGDTRDPQ